jgi:anti-sigma B factor antagonist
MDAHDDQRSVVALGFAARELRQFGEDVVDDLWEEESRELRRRDSRRATRQSVAVLSCPQRVPVFGARSRAKSGHPAGYKSPAMLGRTMHRLRDDWGSREECAPGKVIASGGNLWQNGGHVPRGAWSMEIKTRQNGSATIVDVVGDITLYNSPDVRKVVLDLLKEKKVKRVIMNLTAVRYIDSAGVASLVEGLKVSRDLKSTFALFGLSRTAREVLELTRLIKVFEVYDNEAAAVQGGATPAPTR